MRGLYSFCCRSSNRVYRVATTSLLINTPVSTFVSTSAYKVTLYLLKSIVIWIVKLLFLYFSLSIRLWSTICRSTLSPRREGLFFRAFSFPTTVYLL
jgi:hypothetical protein